VNAISHLDQVSAAHLLDSGRAAHTLRELVHRHRDGTPLGLVSVCSAHPLVIQAAAHQAREDDSTLLVEATSNQVDQDGGYTGMRPADFVGLVTSVTTAAGLPVDRVVLGGDHLGPNRWRGLGAEEAMRRSEELVTGYVAAGFAKIHLDCSMRCAGDPEPLPGSLVAKRAARLAAVADAAAAVRGRAAPVYVVGSEVPVPGGAHEDIEQLRPTRAEDARATLQEHRNAFAEAGIGGAWERVVALVVQPAVEFDHKHVVDFRPEVVRDLVAVLDEMPGLVYEAHSTDYQTPAALAQLVRHHWAILKVGPGLTFALREALFALAAIEDELVPVSQRSHLVSRLETAMLEDPSWWSGYYTGDEDEQLLERRYSYSDRSRYYWQVPDVDAAVDTLLTNLDTRDLPLPLLSQHLPLQYRRVRSGALSKSARALAVDRVRDVLRDYTTACHRERTGA
jgi:D-tagatose-1,6-bisphosphate aldolase subunit GatZ/KbaZ